MNLKQIKEQIAALLNVDSVNAKSLFELANCNSVVLTAIQSVEPSQFNLRTTETWQAILNKLKGEGVNESLSSECGGVTGNDINSSEIVVNSSEVNYIVVTTDYPQVVIKDDYTAKDLTEVTEDQLSDSLYTDKVTAELMFPGTYYQVLEVNSSNIRQELTEYFNNKFEVIVATETSDNKYKGIPVEHFTTEEYSWHTCMIYTAEQPDNTVFLHNNKQHFYLASKDTFGKGYDYDISMSKKMLPMIKAAKQYLMTEDEKINQAIASNQVHQYAAVLGGQQQKQVFVSEPLPGSLVLSPKLYLFTASIEFTYLANCFSYLLSELTKYNKQWNNLISEFSSNIFELWFTVNDLVHDSYIPQPLPTRNDYVTMWQLLYC